MTEYFIAKNVANMMTKPDPDSALDSQVLAGTFVIMEKHENDYCYIKTPDLYHGWVHEKRLVEAYDRSNYKTICVKSLFAPLFSKPDENASLISQLVISTRLPLAKEVDQFVEILLPNKEIAYTYKHCVEPWEKSLANENIFEEKWHQSTKDERAKILEELGINIVNKAKLFMGTPYLWGGGTPYGIDCSGLTQLCYKLCGVLLLRNSSMQYADKRFTEVDADKTFAQAKFKAGDLVYFSIKRNGKVNHIGIACGDDTFIHSRGEMLEGGMVINRCDDTYYNEVYIGANRLLATADININASS